MNDFKDEIEAVAGGEADDSLLRLLLVSGSAERFLLRAANRVRLLGKGAYVKRRALIEITNDCLNNCLYCGIRAANRELPRYCLDKERILDAAAVAYGRGLRTFVLQGGENPALTDSFVTETVVELKRRFPDAAVTLSLGERPTEVYRLWREAGADRYLLRHETINADHYKQLHPRDMSRQNRLRCLDDLKSLGYRTGTGFLVGSPFQTVENLIEDLRFISGFRPGMIGIGPFIPADNTPFASYPPGSARLTLRCIALLRLMNPDADIPATTALGSLGGEKLRMKALLGGANVIMPNFTPLQEFRLYTLYNNKSRL